ncbi:MAG: hypothetical protein RIT45_894 [Pseudomonadota bacterium]|jgi:histidinol-phosphate aminotransferase
MSLVPLLDVDGVIAYVPPDLDRTAFLRLDVNEDPRGAPAHVVQALQRELTPHALATYPAYGALRAAAAAAAGVAPDQVLLCNGGDQGLEAILRLYLPAGRALVTHAPGFDMFPLWGRLHHAVVIGVPLAALGPAHLDFDADAFLAAIDAAIAGPGLGAVALVTPNNPTGSIVPRAATLQVLERVAALPTPCPVIVDETYVDFGGESVVDWLDRFPFLFVQRSLSKSAGLAGLRLGWVLGHPTEIVRLERALEPFRVNRAAVVAGLAALEGAEGGRPAPWLQERVAEIRAARSRLAEGLQALGLAVGAREANFLLVHVGQRHAAFCDTMQAQGILVRDRDGKHPLLAGCVRIGVGSLEQVERTLCAARVALAEPPALDALILDMDGTLVDVSGSCRRAIVETVRGLLAEAGIDVVADDAMVDAFKARGGLNNDWDCADAMLREHGVQVPYDAIVARHQAAYRGTDWDGFIADERWLCDAALVDAAAARYRLGLVTGRPTEEARFTLRRDDAPFRAERGSAMEVVVGMDDTDAGKPDPAGILLACRQMGLDPTRVAYVGDAVDDMRAARAAGAFAIGVLAPGRGWNSGWPERLAAAGAHIVARDVQEAVRWLTR